MTHCTVRIRAVEYARDTRSKQQAGRPRNLSRKEAEEDTGAHAQEGRGVQPSAETGSHLTCLEAELVELLGVPEAADIGVKEAVLGEDEPCGLHGPKCAAEVAHVDGRVPAVIQLRELLQP